MNPNFSLHRIGLLLRRDWIEYRKRLGSFLLTLMGCIFFFLCVYKGTAQVVDRQYSFFCFGMLACFIFFLSTTSKRIHHSKGLFLTLPASSAEKFLALLLTGVIVLLTFIVIFWIGIHCITLFITDYPTIDVATVVSNINKSSFSNINVTGFLAFTASLVFLAYVRFAKYAFGYVVCGFLLLAGLIAGTVYLVASISQYEGSLYKGYCTYSDIYPFLSTVQIIPHIFAPVMFIASAVILYVAYLKLKEKELR